MAEYDYRSRQQITKRLEEELTKQIHTLQGPDQKLAKKLQKNGWVTQSEFYNLYKEIFSDTYEKPSKWFTKEHQALLDVFVPQKYQASFLYIIDKINQFPFSRGWMRRTVRTADYSVQLQTVFALLSVYRNLFFCNESLEDCILGRLGEEKRDYIRYEHVYNRFSYLYAAEIDRGNTAVIEALREVMLSETNTSYLDREMILGILRSDHQELQELLGKLLVAARLQEGLRQAICEAMDDGTTDAFLRMFTVIEENDLIRFSAVKRAVFTWIGIYEEGNADRIAEKLLHLMGNCLRDSSFREEQLQTEDTMAINTALWAIGFYEVKDAVRALKTLIHTGTRHQKLAASFYTHILYDENLRLQIAKEVIRTHNDDLEMMAAYMRIFNSRFWNWSNDAFEKENCYTRDLYPLKEPVITKYYKDREEAEAFYQYFSAIAQKLPKKGVSWQRETLEPSQVLCQMAFLAYLLQDEEKITQMAKRIGDIENNCRSIVLNLLLYEPSNQTQRELAIQYMGNANAGTSDMAIRIVKKMSLKEEEYLLLESMLRFKRSDLRKTLLEFLEKQTDAPLGACIERLLTDKKEEKRCAGLDLLLRLSKDAKRTGLFKQAKASITLIEKPTDKEQILIQELTGKSNAQNASQEGYGIYNRAVPEELLPSAAVKRYESTTPEELLTLCMPIDGQTAAEKIKKLDRLIQEHKDYEYETAYGSKQLLGNDYTYIKNYSEENGSRQLENYPLADVFRRFYEDEIKDYPTLLVIEMVLCEWSPNLLEVSLPIYKKLFHTMPIQLIPLGLQYPNQINRICNIYREQFLDQKQNKKLLFKIGLLLFQALTPLVENGSKIVTYKTKGWGDRVYDVTRWITHLPLIHRYLKGLSYWETDEEFLQAFETAWKFEKICREGRKRRDFVPSGDGIGRSEQSMTGVKPYWFLKAYHLGVIEEDVLYRAIMEYFGREDCLLLLCKVMKKEAVKPLCRQMLNLFFGEGLADEIYETGESYFAEDTWIGTLLRQMYHRIVPVLVDTELRRGEEETIFSWDMRGITYIEGIDYLVRILMALGKDTLGREMYYSWYYGSNNRSKREVLSGLLKSCYPKEGETSKDLKAALSRAHISEKRLVEVAMYAPQWIDLLEEYLGWAGLKSGCYYFMAHMNERFDDQKKAIIARYTPLSSEELQDGAFDAAWFEEAYSLLGEAHFDQLYQAAKYISDGQKHSRARKYADAASGKVKKADLKKEISDKRNKDLLMSYGLLPFGRNKKKDLVERYQFIEQFRKESRQFGAQRRASEGKASEIALLNLSVRAGYADVTRLKLTMEAQISEAFAPLMAWTKVDDVEVCLQVDSEGQSKILCRKGEKALKSVPSRLGKQAHILKLKEANKQLKEQYRRTKKMMEEAMESGSSFYASELLALWGNPVVRAVLESLVFLHQQQFGFLKVEEDTLCLVSIDGTYIRTSPEDTMIIAHPYHFYQAKNWHSYQKYLFDQKIRQPFKQVFRELYTKLPEELGATSSQMFAGNQIQPQKTVGCLKGRRWVADYEEGLQKVYYKENIIARIYALADWFSPADIEAPTLEWVEFFDRKTFASLTIQEVPDLIYSEVMRDVDLAVSVAHVGGVDPETSHSTIEMRRAIIDCNLSLFGFTNVTFKDSHALIQGTRADYNVHLGSGVVHQQGGAMLQILPVHSQQRGRIFLPFVDEDPKTAEILSKIILLAEDQKIKDPSILDQIQIH